MFERFQAINYQVLEDLRLRLDPGVTVIVGRNDAGKSAALRAFEWLCTNRPPGNADIRHGTEGMAARLWVDGHVIERHKSATRNIYKLDGQTFKAFGNDVPAEIAQILNVDEINFQGQHEAPFWFTATPADLCRQLNAIVDLGIIDDSITYIAKEVRHQAAVYGVSQERLKSAIEARDYWQHAPDVDQDLTCVELLASRAALCATQAARCAGLAGEARNYGTRGKRLQAAAQAGRAVVGLATVAREAAARAERCAGLAATARANMAIRQPGLAFEDVVAAQAAYTTARNKATTFSKECLAASLLKRRVSEIESELELAKAALAAIEVCPTCQRPI
jgi:energy-coupling factor transporter ATP-binding protein EcfA2